MEELKMESSPIIDRKIFVREWIKDLRSGKYKQGKGQLAELKDDKPVKFCCLGLACLTAQRLKIPNSEFTKFKSVFGKSRLGQSYDNSTPGEWFANIMGGWTNPMLDSHNSCVHANDDLNWSFDKIAGALEKLYLKD